MAKHSQTIIGVARSLYLQRWTPKEIANELNLPNARIIYYWAQKWHWADMLSHESIEEAINRRILVLANRDNKNELELKEVDSLIAQHCKLMAQKSKHAEKLAAIKAQTQGSYASGEEAGARDDNGGGKRKYRKNDISGIQQEELELFAGETLFFYQQYLRANKHHAIRNILKSRQIGATWYFAFEALEDAIISGDPQIFLSASRAQAEVFRSYIVNIAQQFFGVTLTGNGVFELVQNFAMRQAVAIHYGLESKNRLVMKMVDVIESQRIEWDGEQKEIPASFLAIRRTSTAKGGGMTFVADRTKETGHADVFFAIAHAIDNEPLNFEHQRKSTWKTSKAA